MDAWFFYIVVLFVIIVIIIIIGCRLLLCVKFAVR